MNWNTPFVVYRLSADGKLEEVFKADDIKKAKYWLTYIAQAGDVLCKTPAHPKHSQATPAPEYHGHKEQSGKPSADETQWKSFASAKGWNNKFPETPTGEGEAKH